MSFPPPPPPLTPIVQPTIKPTIQPHSPIPDHVNHATLAVEQSRAIAEVLGQIKAAKEYPRIMSEVYDRLKDSCSRMGLAKASIYSYPKGGATVTGSSIRLAEEIARCYGNIEYGIREMSKRDGISEMMAFARDLENNVSSTKTFTVEHVSYTKSKGKQALVDPRDIYEVGANQGARRVRACILAVVGKHLEEFALEECKKTMQGDISIPIQDRINEMISAFKAIGVTSENISHRLGKNLDNILPDEIAELRGIFNSIRDNFTTASDWFNVDKLTPSPGSTADKINKGIL
jgi:hypothetical protein